MNRVLVLGVAIFFAVVGIAMISGDSTVVAGHGCKCDCDCGGCDCCCDTCCGTPVCCEPVACGCCGAAPAPVMEPAEEVAPAPAAYRAPQRRPFGFRTVKFRR